MTAPSAVLASIAETLKLELAALFGGDAVKDVRAHDSLLSADTKDLMAPLSDPGVLVVPLGGPLTEDDQAVPLQASMAFLAICIARTPKPGSQQGTRGAVALDLACAVAEIVANATFAGTHKRADKVRIVNETAARLSADKGTSVWTVFWVQPIDLIRPRESEINRLGTIHFTFVQGGEDTPKAEAQIDFPENAP